MCTGVLQIRCVMGIPELQALLRSSMSVKTDAVSSLYACVAAALGFDRTGAMDVSSAMANTTLCSCDGALNGSTNGSGCINISCLYNPVSWEVYIGTPVLLLCPLKLHLYS